MKAPKNAKAAKNAKTVQATATKAAKPTTAPAPADDPRVGQLLHALRQDPKTARSVADFEAAALTAGRKSFGSNGLKVEGKLFALFTQDTLVVKLPRDRVAALVEAGAGRPFDPGHGRLMKEWLTVSGTKPAWLELAREAHAFVAGHSR